MKIKINQVTQSSQVESLLKYIDIVNICVSKEDNKVGFISLDTFREIKLTYPSVKFSIFFDESFMLEEQTGIAKQLDIYSLEFVCQDVRQQDKFEEFFSEIILCENA